MQAFTQHSGKTAVLFRGNIDTDQIISKEHLKSIKRTGFGPSLFSDWRYLSDGSENPDFALNQPQNKNATILLAGHNFGCGSSREHAVWAIMQFGFRAVIAPTMQKDDTVLPAFADIFRNNSSKNGLLLVELSEADTLKVKEAVEAHPEQELTLDLVSQTLSIANVNLKFEIDEAIKERLLKGLDDIGSTLIHEDKISEFEKTHDTYL